MRSEDVRPTRLKHAKLFIRNLIKSNPGDRFGLIAFAGSAFLECPLTVDKTSIFQTLDEMNTDSIPLGGTNIENALDTALLAFQAAEGGYRAIILITDGDELSGNSSKSIARLKKLKIPLFIVGIGDPSGAGLIKMTGPDGKPHLLRDTQGKLVKSRLNEVQLKKLFKETGGIYVRSTATEPELAAINKRVRQLIPKQYSKSSSKRPIEKFHYPLCAAIILLLIRFGIGERRKDKIVSMLLCITFIASFSPNASAQDSPLTTATKQKAAVEATKKVKSIETKATPASLYNRALELHIKGNKDDAKKIYKEAINLAKVAPSIRSKAFQNLGVIAHREARSIMKKDPDKALKIMDQAEVMYKEAMRSDTTRKRVILNQQKLLDDRILAKKIKKFKEELEKKKKEAQNKTKEAHDQQKKENDQKQKKKQKSKNQSNKKEKRENQEKKNNQQQSSQEDRENKQQKSKSNKNNQKESKSNSQKSKKKSTEEKIRDAQKACEQLQDAAERHKRPEIKQVAEKAERELKKAEEEHNKNNGGKAEEHLKKAMDQLKSGEKKEDKDQQDQGKKKNNKQNEKKDNSREKASKNDRELEKQNSQKDKKGEAKKEKASKEKPIDPRQAATLLEMMANDEKTLRDKIKENKRRNTRVKKVLKDW